MSEKRRLEREPGTARPRVGRLERGSDAHEEDDLEPHKESGRRRRARGGRPLLMEDMTDINRGMMMVSVESAAIAMDIISRVLRGAVDRAFDEDYENPGDIVKGLAGETDLAVHDLVTELRNVPRRLTRKFDDAVRTPTSDQGERKRRADGGATHNQGDTPASKG